MAVIADPSMRTDLINRLKRAEGQLRGVQRMLGDGEACADIAAQMSAVRKALDSTYVRMAVCYMEQEIGTYLKANGNENGNPADGMAPLLDEIQSLLGKLR